MNASDGSNIGMTIAIVLGLTLWGMYAERHRWLSKMPGVVWILTTGLLLSNLGWIPMKSPVYDFIGGYLMPLGIPLLLYKANLRSILRDNGMVLPIFLIGSVTVSIGAALGFLLFDLGAMGAKVAATYTAGWVGGMTNFMALAQITAMTPTEFSVALSASAPVSILGLLALLTLPSVPWVRRQFRSSPQQSADASDGLSANAPVTHLNVMHLILALTLSAVICAAAGMLTERLGWQNYGLFIISIITVVVANLASKRLAKLDGDFDLGMLIMYLFFAVIGAGTDLSTFLTAAPTLFFFGLWIIAVHLVLLLVVTKWCKFELSEVIIGSGANIVGPAASAGIASSKGWSRLVTPAITIGMLGNAVANFYGIALFRLLS